MKMNIISKALLLLAIGINTSAMAANTYHKSENHKVTKKAELKSGKKTAKVPTKKTKEVSRKKSKAVVSSKYKVAKKETPVKHKSVANYSPNNIKYSVFNYQNGEVLEESNSSVVWPIASLTKLMTAYVFVNNIPNINSCSTAITAEDNDILKNTRTKLAKNVPMSCSTLLNVMLIASDNYAASALARSVPGWSKAEFIRHMNIQAKNWGLNNTHFVDSSGLSPENRSSVDDYRKLAMNVVKNKTISDISSNESIIADSKNRQITYRNSNKLVREYGLDVNLSKTGHINESGYNLVHLADCQNPIGVIEFGARSSDQRAYFVKQKLSKYGCI